MSDRFVQAARGGDPEAFAALYQDHAPRVYALCLRLTGDPARAEEATQDTFVRVWENLGSFRGDSAFGSWLHRVAVNTVVAAGRSESRRRRRVELVERVDNLPAAGRQDRVEDRLDLETAIANLPDVARQVYVLNQIEGYGHEEIGALLGIAASTSRVHLCRARERLSEALEP